MAKYLVFIFASLLIILSGCSSPDDDKDPDSPAIEGNLVVNGDFESGNVGFLTDYHYQSGGQGIYYLATDASALNVWWTGGDHSSGNGLFMIVDGAYNSAMSVWNQNVAVHDYTDYEFSFYYRKVDTPTNDITHLAVSVNGTPVSDEVSVTNASWALFTGKWNSGAATSAHLDIHDSQTVSGGNGGDDFGLDDIVFQKSD
jgi:large repetitive protein